MGKTALIVVDLQNDFCEGGSLAVSDANAVIQPINDLIQSREWELIVATKDWHTANHISFASQHSGAKPFDKYQLVPKDPNGPTQTSILWPDHCIQESAGAEFVNGFETRFVTNVVHKGHTAEFYSAFEDVLRETRSELPDLLKSNAITDVVVVGLAYDYCVAHTALDSARFGYRTSIELSCVRGISEESISQARKKLEASGVIHNS